MENQSIVTDYVASRAENSNQSHENVSSTQEEDDPFYPMNHGRRGDCIIFTNEKFDHQGKREAAKKDSKLCEKAFQKLGFAVEQYGSLTTRELQKKLEEVRKRDHSPCDALVVVFMSHGLTHEGQELVCTRDGFLPTCELWEPFAPDQCPSLKGKPKLFFIQACRGHSTDKGVGLTVVTDSSAPQRARKSPVPHLADHLVMWSSAQDHYAFRTSRYENEETSVFIYFLAKSLQTSPHLTDIVLKVSREVAIQFESSNSENKEYHGNKQAPNMSSTLLRNVCFSPEAKSCPLSHSHGL